MSMCICLLCVQMFRVKQLLTEVLLDVTNNEIVDIARLVYTAVKAKQARGSTGWSLLSLSHIVSCIEYECQIQIFHIG